MISPWHYRLASKIIHRGGIIAYPTEAVYGLGCDPLNYHAVEKICQLKNRSLDKGLILVASDPGQLLGYTTIPLTQLNKLATSANAAISWLVPAHPHCPPWLSGNHDTIAVRFSRHPVVKTLCENSGYALVSTSANQSGLPPRRTALGVQQIFGTEVDLILHANTGGKNRPSEIRDFNTGETLRAG